MDFKISFHLYLGRTGRKHNTIQSDALSAVSNHLAVCNKIFKTFVSGHGVSEIAPDCPDIRT